jgi:hypothetical protein
MKIVVQIDRLVLDGLTVAPHEHALLQAAIEAELSRLLTDGGIASGLLAGGATPSIAGGALAAGVDQQAAPLGEGIARAVYAGIGGKP